ncbi:hypothetical protein LshimejAT787_1301910 [Lyophyllum shimeji]|uniref:Uncharacterized protein n=1 Tax=Lyophyllum shimeji TaxID=47721 RepID=A0A9P3PUR5_LYOSH|nr:hypothetical protein LshimejAT787_1301910 [Lyophyllum shimeji]
MILACPLDNHLDLVDTLNFLSVSSSAIKQLQERLDVWIALLQQAHSVLRLCNASSIIPLAWRTKLGSS